MGNLGHQAARLAASKICDNIVKGLCKDPETEVVKLIDMWQKFMGDEKIDLNCRRDGQPFGDALDQAHEGRF